MPNLDIANLFRLALQLVTAIATGRLVLPAVRRDDLDFDPVEDAGDDLPRGAEHVLGDQAVVAARVGVQLGQSLLDQLFDGRIVSRDLGQTPHDIFTLDAVVGRLVLLDEDVFKAVVDRN